MVAGFDDAWALASSIDGWLSRGQALELFRRASEVPPGAWAVEIGSHHGRSTVVVARGLPDGARVMAVDPFDDPRWGGGPESLATFRANLRAGDVEQKVDIFRGLSKEAAQEWNGEPIGLLFVDGAHDRPSVLTDIDGWERHIRVGGSVCFHDTFSSPGVTFAVLQRHALSRRFRYEGAERTLVSFRRTDATLGTAAMSCARLAARLPAFARNLAIKMAIRRRWRRALRLLGHPDFAQPY